MKHKPGTIVYIRARVVANEYLGYEGNTEIETIDREKQPCPNPAPLLVVPDEVVVTFDEIVSRLGSSKTRSDTSSNTSS